MSHDNFGDPGPSRVTVVAPPKPGNVDDCLDEIYAALTRHGYALTLGDYHGTKMMVLSKAHAPGRLEPVAQIGSIVPGDRKDPRVGIIKRNIAASERREIVQ